MLPPTGTSLGLIAASPTLSKHSLILIMLWVGIYGQVSRVHQQGPGDRRSGKHPPNMSLATQAASCGVGSSTWWLWLTRGGGGGGKSLTLSTLSRHYSQDCKQHNSGGVPRPGDQAGTVSSSPSLVTVKTVQGGRDTTGCVTHGVPRGALL